MMPSRPAGSIKAMDLSPCTVQPCTFQHGINATVKLDFITNSTSTSLKTQVYGIVAGVPIAFPLPNPDACTGCDVTCPIKPGTVYDYANILAVRKEYPSLSLVVKWQLVGDNNVVIACVLFPITIDGTDTEPLPTINKPLPTINKPLPAINNNSKLYKPPFISNKSNNPSIKSSTKSNNHSFV
ncbi:NPC intracellular cholesterol transporter 2 [Patella vulgata]|uniref:NPC intracellular cholesterol transporter 2 n=1 Tax=Patella vulgata TaxID=6465 RepID=UPI0021802A3D|nr:NPC intracellular cholesterol transporter 2 [Patella vulgata]